MSGLILAQFGIFRHWKKNHYSCCEAKKSETAFHEFVRHPLLMPEGNDGLNYFLAAKMRCCFEGFHSVLHRRTHVHI